MSPLLRVASWLSLAFLSAAVSRAAAPAEESRDVFASLVRQNDAQVSGWLAALPPRAASPREAARLLKLCAAAYAEPSSRHHRTAALQAVIERLVGTLRARQNADGSFDSEFGGGNAQSPPDAGFVLRHLAQAEMLLAVPQEPGMAGTLQALRAIVRRGALVLRTGGVHTPNHRWVICGALSHIEVVAPAAANVARIDDWLGEGIDQDRDGQFSERSTIYSSVTIEALVDLALNLRRPALLAPVRRHLEFLLLNAEPNGELETVSSRRQDQLGREPRKTAAYYVALRYLAILDGDGRYAALVRQIEREDQPRIIDHVAEWILWPELRRPLPASAPLPDDFVRHFPASGLVRVRRGPVSATIFGGSDWAAQRDISSGLATNPTFFKFRKGAAVLESVRMAPAFFNLGYFRSEGLEVSPDGREFRLRQTQRAAYYQPLPAAARRPDGDYPLTNDGRFYSKMDFPRRPRDDRELTTRVTVRETNPAGGFELEIESAGTAGIGLTIEFCFRSDGTLTGVQPRPGEADVYFLPEGTARFTAGQDTIEIGPGHIGPTRVGSMAGEEYSWRNGQLAASGLRVYVTGVTPFKHRFLVK